MPVVVVTPTPVIEETKVETVEAPEVKAAKKEENDPVRSHGWGRLEKVPTLEGILLEEGAEPYCLIDGEIFKVGDYHADKQIVAITRRNVKLINSQGESFLLKMK